MRESNQFISRAEASEVLQERRAVRHILSSVNETVMQGTFALPETPEGREHLRLRVALCPLCEKLLDPGKLLPRNDSGKSTLADNPFFRWMFRLGFGLPSTLPAKDIVSLVNRILQNIPYHSSFPSAPMKQQTTSVEVIRNFGVVLPLACEQVESKLDCRNRRPRA